jgi:hypothetical protein
LGALAGAGAFYFFIAGLIRKLIVFYTAIRFRLMAKGFFALSGGNALRGVTFVRRQK